jgi:hypothetical protein
MTRVRMQLDGGHMDVSLAPGASPETVAALKEIGQAAVAMMARESEAEGEVLAHLHEGIETERLGFEW